MLSLNVTVFFLMVSKRDFFSSNDVLFRSTGVGEIVALFHYLLVEINLAFLLGIKPSALQ
jgi:hypothetical protein